jgi:hypothetical protein
MGNCGKEAVAATSRWRTKCAGVLHGTHRKHEGRFAVLTVRKKKKKNVNEGVQLSRDSDHDVPLSDIRERRTERNRRGMEKERLWGS